MNKKLYDLMNWADIEEIVYIESKNPERILGPHKVKNGILIQAFFHDAQKVIVCMKTQNKEFEMEMADEEGFFACLINQKKFFNYYYKVSYDGKNFVEKEDLYLYANLIENDDIKRFDEGIHTDAYNFLGSRFVNVKGYLDSASFAAKKTKSTVEGVHFCVWAPSAQRVSVVGNFNDWDGSDYQMCAVGESGLFELFIPGLKEDELYKYEIKRRYDLINLKRDPYATRTEENYTGASIIDSSSDYKWNDAKWIKNRKLSFSPNKNFMCMEICVGDYRDKDGNALNYKDIADEVIKVIDRFKVTHVLLMPIFAYADEESHGYMTMAHFSLSERNGSADDFKAFVDKLHSKNIGVLVDFSAVYFPKYDDGLKEYDGEFLYESADESLREHPFVDANCFDFDKNGVKCYLYSVADYWINNFHIDGYSFNSVETALYLDYGRNENEWKPNMYGGNENINGVSFFTELNKTLHDKYPGIIMIAQEQNGYMGITDSIENNGIGFDLKWNEEIKKDILDYLMTADNARVSRYNLLTDPLVSSYSENYIIPLDHDFALNNFDILLNEINGNEAKKSANLKLLLAYLSFLPGKKLIYYGLLKMLSEKDMKEIIGFIEELSSLIEDHPALSKNDDNSDAFEWVSCLDSDHGIITFTRFDCSNGGKEGSKDNLFFVFNFMPVLYENFIAGVPANGRYKEIFNSDAPRFGGAEHMNHKTIHSNDVVWDGKEQSINIKVGPLSVLVFSYESP